MDLRGEREMRGVCENERVRGCDFILISKSGELENYMSMLHGEPPTKWTLNIPEKIYIWRFNYLSLSLPLSLFHS